MEDEDHQEVDRITALEDTVANMKTLVETLDSEIMLLHTALTEIKDEQESGN